MSLPCRYQFGAVLFLAAFAFATSSFAQNNVAISGTSGTNTVTNSYSTTGGLNLSLDFAVDYLVVGGGGGGGSVGGGGGGGVLAGSMVVAQTNYAVTVGQGGAGASGWRVSDASNGSNSIFHTNVALGGGYGGRDANSTNDATAAALDGNSGGSGGGGGFVTSTFGSGTRRGGGSGTAGQGYNGFYGQYDGSVLFGGGGGGAGAAATNVNGGRGFTSSITGVTNTYAGGGGGGSRDTSAGVGAAGGGNGSSSTRGSNAVANTGSGGGGGGITSSPFGGGNGGSGVVIIRYLGPSVGNIGGTVTEGTGSATGYTIHTFTNTGTNSFNLTGVNFNTRLGATLSGTLTGNGGLTYQGPGALTLAASNSFTGDTRAAGGTLDLGHVDALANSVLDMNAADNGAVNLTLSGQTYNIAGLQGSRALALSNNRISVGSNGTNTVYSGAMSGTGGLTKVGGGNLTLSGNNTYSGATTVAGGTLVVDGSINNSTVTVQSGATLGGSGSVGGIVINTGGTINPGNSPGTQNVVGDVLWNGGGNYNWQIFNASGTKGSTNGWDWLNASGSLNLSNLSVTNQFNINLWSLSGISPDTNGSAVFFTNTSNYTWTILTASNGITGFSADKFAINLFATNGTAGFANALGGGTFSIAQSGNNLNLVFTTPAIPEPGTWAAAALLAGTAGFVGWRKRSKVS